MIFSFAYAVILCQLTRQHQKKISFFGAAIRTGLAGHGA